MEILCLRTNSLAVSRRIINKVPQWMMEQVNMMNKEIDVIKAQTAAMEAHTESIKDQTSAFRSLNAMLEQLLQKLQ